MKKVHVTLFTLLLLGVAGTATAEADPYLVQGQVHSDLDSMLSRLIPVTHYFVQVTSDVILKQERQIIEGETVTLTESRPKESPRIMPGFLPELDPEPPKPPAQSRQVYRMVEKPMLRLLRVSVTFDEEVEPAVMNRARTLIQNYLRTAHPSTSSVQFNVLPLLKPKKEEKVEEKKPELPVEPPKKEDPLAEYYPYLAAALAFLLLLSMFRRPQARPRRAAPREPAHQPQNPYWGMDGRGGMMDPRQLFRRFQGEEGESSKKETPPPKDTRKNLLHRFMSRSNAFRAYYRGLGEEAKEELYSILKGPAYNNFLQGTGIKPPSGDIPEPPEPQEILEKQEKDFEEFVQAKDWQERQFFGYLQDLSNDQLLSLVNHMNPMAVCIMLRFMNPGQSAFVLESMGPTKRRDVLDQVNHINETSFTQIVALEREVRDNVQRMPTHLFGSKNEDIEYWGNVLTEASDQEGILEDIEKTNPGIYPNLKRYKFKLEDAVSLPESLLQKILADSDNDELSLALATCPSDLVDVFLDAISSRRREAIEFQLAASKTAAAQVKKEARQKLTKRFREAMQ